MTKKTNIFKNDIESLQYLRLDVFNNLNDRNVGFNILEIFGIFDLIIIELEKNDINMAYSIFLNAYGISSNFDEVN